MKISRYAKAVVASAMAGLAAVSTALEDGMVTGPEWVTAGVALVVGLTLTYKIPNKEPASQTPN